MEYREGARPVLRMFVALWVPLMKQRDEEEEEEEERERAELEIRRHRVALALFGVYTPRVNHVTSAWACSTGASCQTSHHMLLALIT